MSVAARLARARSPVTMPVNTVPLRSLPAQAASGRTYHVGRNRARAQLKNALAATDVEAQRRRVKAVVKSIHGEQSCAEIERVAKTKLAELAQLDDEACPRKLQIEIANRGRAMRDPVDGNFNWIRQKNDEQHRKARRDIAALTQCAIKNRGYMLGDSVVVLKNTAALVKGTRLVSRSVGDWPAEYNGLPSSTWTKQTSISSSRGVVFEVAMERRSSGKRVVAVNAASAYHSGGGFHTGGRHALEEAMCIQSTLPISLARAESIAKAAGLTTPDWVQPPQRRDGTAWHLHVPMDGCVLSPCVEIFRGGTNEGYPFSESPSDLEAVVSVAMPNCNDRMSDSPVDANPDPDKYAEQLKQRWRAVLAAASFYTEANCLVVPDAGCGVFQNPPEQVGAALGAILKSEFEGRFEEVIVAFPGGNAGPAFTTAMLAAAGR